MTGARVIKGLAILAVGGVLGLVILLGGLWLEHSSELTLPSPSGPLPVGRMTASWVDGHSIDTLAPAEGVRREVLVWIWYPASVEPTGSMGADYMPAQMRDAADRARGPLPLPARLMRNFLTRDIAKVRARSVENPALAPERTAYPVVIMRGGASAPVMNYSTLAEDLASHGYVVVGVDAPYRTSLVVFPDGRVISRTPANDVELCVGAEEQVRCVNKLLAAWTADLRFVLDRLEQLNAADPGGRLTGRLDLTRIGVFGHSFGGAQAAQFCHEDARCKAGIDVDGQPFGSVIQTGMDKAFMFLLSDHGDTSADAEARQVMANIQSIYDRLPPERRLMVAIKGANHFTFSDDGALLKSRLVRGAMRLFGVLGIDGPRQLTVATYCISRFFDVYLKDATASRLDIASPQYPELQVLQ